MSPAGVAPGPSDVIEQCAKIAEEAYADPNWHMLYRMAGTAIAARIRDLSQHTEGERAGMPDAMAISEAYSDWSWEKEGQPVGLMLPNESARAGFFAGAKWMNSRLQGDRK